MQVCLQVSFSKAAYSYALGKHFPVKITLVKRKKSFPVNKGGIGA